MLKSLSVSNFTVFPRASFQFGRNLNVIVGVNGTGKTHILKAAYAAISVLAVRGRDGVDAPHQTSWLETALAAKLIGVFQPDELGRLVSRKRGQASCRLSCDFAQKRLALAFRFSTAAQGRVKLETAPGAREKNLPVYLPTRELLTIAPGFVALYEMTDLRFEETWRDTCVLLQAPLARGPREKKIRELLVPIEAALGGKVEADRAGRFYLKLDSGRMEMHLVAEGLRKLAMLARLIATGSLLDKGYLFWDEPEANLNPRIIRTIAKTILSIANNGIQVFVGTHSLFLLRELHVLQKNEFPACDTRCFGLDIGPDGFVTVQQGKTMDDVGAIALLDEEIDQADRYMNTEMGLADTDQDPRA